MRTIIFFSIQLFLMSYTFAEMNAQEPKQLASLKINGATHSVVVGEESELTIDNQPFQVVLELDPIRKFAKEGISFDYSSDKNFSYQNLSSVVDHWELSGSHSTIMVQKYPKKTSKRDIYKAFEEEFKLMKADLNIKSINLHSNGSKFNGKRLIIDLGNAHLTQDIFVFELKDATLTLIMQDSVEKNGANTKEFQDTMNLMRDSLIISG